MQQRVQPTIGRHNVGIAEDEDLAQGLGCSVVPGARDSIRVPGRTSLTPLEPSKRNSVEPSVEWSSTTTTSIVDRGVVARRPSTVARKRGPSLWLTITTLTVRATSQLGQSVLPGSVAARGVSFSVTDQRRLRNEERGGGAGGCGEGVGEGVGVGARLGVGVGMGDSDPTADTWA